MSDRTPSSRPDEAIANTSNPAASHDRQVAPNLIARSDNIGRSRPGGYDEKHRSESSPDASARFAQQSDHGHLTARDQVQSHHSYGPAQYHMSTPQTNWPAIDPRYPQRLDTSMPHLIAQPHQPYQYPQHSMQYGDPWAQYGRDVRFYAADITPGQSYPMPSDTYDYASTSRYRQHNYSHPGPLAYEQPQSAFAVPQSPVHMRGADFPQVYARSVMSPHGSAGPTPHVPVGAPYSVTLERRGGPPEPTPSYPRGPPRKPKQSGFAVWVGNLSPGTTILDLKDYFSRGASRTIESVFLISKSNCAFVNYKTAESAQGAVARFHDTRLNGARLVCRLRHGQAPTTATQPSAPAGNPPTLSPNERRGTDTASAEAATVKDDDTSIVDVSVEKESKGDVVSLSVTRETVGPNNERVLEKYFIVKSLTLQDLEASVRDGIWATQSHNESALKEAYENAHHVYLIFSANKSGEYFGYARMKSNINPSAVTTNPRAEASSGTPVDGPTATPTQATDTAPKGRVVDDSARGTIFWEVDSTSSEGGDNQEEDTQEVVVQIDGGEGASGEPGAKQDWGKPFQIEWLSTTRLPFYRTRGLRNPWNSNREVKIARDGTELEPSVGRRLLDLFHQSVVNTGGANTATSPQKSDGPVIAMGSGYLAPSKNT